MSARPQSQSGLRVNNETDGLSLENQNLPRLPPAPPPTPPAVPALGKPPMAPPAGHKENVNR